MINDHAQVNGIKIYYEIYGDGQPLVLLHGGGSTIQTTFGNLIPLLANKYRVIAIELQNHGRSGYRMEPQTFSQDADDVAALLQHLNINKASFFGFSNGGHTCIELALRHPHIIHKLIMAAAPYKRSGFIPGFFEGMNGVTIDNMPKPYHEAFLALTPDKERLQIMFERDRDRMIAFKDWTDDQIRSITAHTLLINGDNDVMTVENTVEMYRLIANCRLAILPGIHGQYIGELTTSKNGKKDAAAIMPLIEEFLDS
ncbi:alpha/beta fold hydrolase [Niastella sp. OAS944]|uniref:alpha/beta fold hydrolase n=1 Tax=Niastella sp. OAS944 TaxID=2664089 RepID=UPI0034971381|nr:pimeloyl-ACP methyl ester carboxylesterase [Chitinophagaceae bacterium OAS944]